MPSRKDIFTNGEIYHIFNKTIDHKKIFSDRKTCWLFLDLIKYYRSLKANIRYSYFKKLKSNFRYLREREIKIRKYFKIEILAYCLMPNHFHLLIQQKVSNGIIRFMSDVLNSLTRFYNLKSIRKGPIFLTQFKSRRIMSREQLLHVSRYIHLNPYSSSIANSVSELVNYEFSSLKEYVKRKNKKILCEPEIILSNITGRNKSYKKFVLSNKNQQKALNLLKHAQKWP